MMSLFLLWRWFKSEDFICVSLVRMRPHVCCQVSSSSSLLSVKSQSIASSGIQQGSSPYPIHSAIIRIHVPTTCHVSCWINTTVIRFCIHLTAKSVKPHVQTMYQHTSLPSTIPSQALAIYTVPDSTTGFVVPFVVQSEPNILFPVLDEIIGVAKFSFSSTLLTEMMTATCLFRSSTVVAHSWRATKRDNADQRHTRSVQSS